MLITVLTFLAGWCFSPVTERKTSGIATSFSIVTLVAIVVKV